MFWNLIDAGLAVKYVKKKIVDLVAYGYVGVMLRPFWFIDDNLTTDFSLSKALASRAFGNIS